MKKFLLLGVFIFCQLTILAVGQPEGEAPVVKQGLLIPVSGPPLNDKEIEIIAALQVQAGNTQCARFLRFFCGCFPSLQLGPKDMDEARERLRARSVSTTL